MVEERIIEYGFMDSFCQKCEGHSIYVKTMKTNEEIEIIIEGQRIRWRNRKNDSNWDWKNWEEYFASEIGEIMKFPEFIFWER